MADNPSWLDLTDEILGLARLRKIRTATVFDSSPSQLNSQQAAAKAYGSFCHQLCGIKATEWFAQARIELPIAAGTPNDTYNLDTGIFPDYLMPESFFNITNGDANARPLDVWNEEYFNLKYPDKSLITTGPPEAVVILSQLSGNNLSPTWQIRVVPSSDKNYTLSYKSKVNAPRLTQATDKILWPYAYWTQITAKAWMLLEMGLGEAKDAQLREIAAEAVSAIKLAGTIAQEARNGIKMFSAMARQQRSSRMRYWKDPRYREPGFYDSPLDDLPTQVTIANRWSL